MTAIIDFVMEIWDWLMRMTGFARSSTLDAAELAEQARFRRALRLLRPTLVILAILYLGVLTWRFAWIRGEDMRYPQQLIVSSALQSSGEETAPESGSEDVKTCAPSQTVRMQAALIDMMVNQNDWAPATPMYTIGFFGLVDWADTPFFDNKAAFQLGALDIMRRFGIELTDRLGRVRGTSGADSDLQGAQSRLQVNERAWVLNNPFDKQLVFLSTSAGSSYRGAIELYERYNARLSRCDALFDVRADNLRVMLDRVAKDLGSTTDQLSKRALGMVYDPKRDIFVPGPGNNRGWFDFRADNLFHRARGQMFALHGLMQAMRADFDTVLKRRDLEDVWDRMEAHIAEAAVLKPLIVSNGRDDGLLMPSHLSAMAQNILRARANMVELRDIIDR